MHYAFICNQNCILNGGLILKKNYHNIHMRVKKLTGSNLEQNILNYVMYYAII